MADRIQQRRDTAERWETFNPILLEGEVGYVTDNPNQYKIGDGIHAWNDLPLRGYTGTISQETGDDENAVISQKVVTEKLTELARQAIYDVTANNDGATFASLSVLLSSENLSTIIPIAVRCGGMSIRFVQSSDNKYMQYILMTTFFSTDTSNWQGIDDIPTSGSKNLVYSNGVWTAQRLYEKQGYQYKGVATKSTTPPDISTIKGGLFYIAQGYGEFSNFKNSLGDAITLAQNKVYIIRTYTNNNVITGWVEEELTSIASKQRLESLIRSEEASEANTTYADCSTEADVSEKNVSIQNYEINKKARLLIRFPNGSTADSVTLNINNTGAKSLLLYGKGVSSKNPIYANDTLDIFYSGGDYKAVRFEEAKNITFGGIATPSTTPLMPTPDRNIYYIASEAGTYTNFGNKVIDGKYLYKLRASFSSGNFSSWVVESLGIPTELNISEKIGTTNFVGFASPSTEPIIPTPKRDYWYLAFTSGTYINFGNIELDGNRVYRIRASYNAGVFNRWIAEQLDIPTKSFVDTILSQVTSDIETAVSDWLEAHPEAIIGVVDGSITRAKLDVSLGEKADAFVIGNTLGQTDSDHDYLSIGRNQNGAKNNQCVAIGSHNMTNNTGVKNITIGNDNMADTTGDRNTSVGYHSLFRNTSGHDNSALGAESQDDTTTGSYNTSMGAYSLQRNRIGEKNTAVGAYALKGTDGDGEQGTAPGRKNEGNTAVGFAALGYAGHNCNNNIAIGVRAMRDSGTISNSIVIGNETEATKDHQMILGSSDITEVVLCGNKKIIFNQDGTVTWETIS